MDKRYLWFLPILALIVWFVYDRQGVPELTLDQAAAGMSYDPYSHWAHTSGGSYIRHYPDRVAPACLAEVLPNVEGALSTTTTMVDGQSVEGGIDGYSR